MTTRLLELLSLMEEDPSDPFLQYVYALELEKSGMLEESISAIQQMMMKHPAYLAAYYQAGRMLDLKGERDAAISVVRAGLKLAQQQNNRHTMAELKYLLAEMTGEDE
jgi:tetratricopeptide (TPR) repeat protein